MLKDQRTYEIMTPETVGLSSSTLVLGKHSGRHAFKVRMEELGFHLTPAELYPAFQRFKILADKKKTITDADLQALATSEVGMPEEIFSLADLQVVSGQPGMPTATVRMRGPGGVEKTMSAVGTGPVDAIFQAIDGIVKAKNTLVEYSVHSVTEGIDALGEVTVRIKGGDGDARTFGGYGADTDVLMASAQAYLAALNRLLVAEGQGSHGREAGPAAVHTRSSAESA